MHNFSHQHLLIFYFTKETKNNIFLENQNPNISNDENEVNKLNDISEVKFLSNNHKKYIRHRPPSNPQWTLNKSEFIKMEQEWGQWGEKRLLQYDEYLSTDATTHEGRQFIAKVNKVEQQWNKMKESKKGNIINTQDRIYALLILVRKEGSGVTINFGPEEGLHRTLGAFMALTGRYINPLEGVCNDKIRLDHLRNIIITPSATNDSIEDVQSVINLALSDSSENVMETGIVEELKQTPYIRQPASVMVRWMSVYPSTKSSSDICKKLRQNSRATSDGKLQSVKISGEANIGIFVNQMIVKMLQNPKVFQSKLDHIPNTSTLQPLQYKITRKKGNETIEKVSQKATEKEFWRPTPWQNIQNSKNDKKLCNEYKERETILSEIENETIISGINQLSFDEKYVNYVSDPFDEEKDRACRSDLLRFQSTTDKNVSCEPPFINSHDSLSSRDLSYVTTWTLNAMWVIPKFIYYLLADKKHETLNNIVRDAEKSELAKQLSLYTVRYHANCYGVNNMKAHGAMKNIYDAITPDEYLIDNENNIIASALFFSDLCNVALTNPNEWSEKESDEDTRVKSVVEGKEDGEDSESLSSATESSSDEYDDDDDDSDVDTVDQEDIDAFSKNGKDFESMLTQLRNKSPCTIEAVIKTTGTYS